MKTVVGIALVAALLLPSRAEAQAREARGRYGFGGYAGLTRSPGDGDVGAGLLGFYVRLGRQFDDTFGLHVDVAGTTVGLLATGRAALVADVTLDDWFTVGTGVVASAYGQARLCVLGPCQDEWTGAELFGVPVHVGFKVPTRRAEAARYAFGVGLDADVGVAPSGAFAYGVHAMIGWERY